MSEARESHVRSVVKAFSWRVVATTTTATIAYLITGEVGVALMIGGIEFVFKIFIYYAHERLWQLVPRGTLARIWNMRRSRSGAATSGDSS